MDGEIRILHVDDDPGFAERAASALERGRERVTVETVTSTRAAMDRLARADVDAVVSDYDVPDRDGIDFLGAVRERHPDLPFVLFTGTGSEEIASEAISAGVSDYLQKGTADQFAVLANRVANLVEKYRAEQARERHRILVDEATDVILVVGPDATIQYATPSAESVLGRTPEELVGTCGFDPVHPEDRARVAEAFTALTGRPADRRTVEFRYQRPDGSWIWAEARGRDLLDEPVVGGVVVYTRDVTGRKERERDLERYETLVENTEDGIYVLGADGRFEFVNRRVADVSGIPQDAWTGEPVSLLADLGTLTESEVITIEESVEAIVRGDADEARIELAPDVPRDLQVLELRLTSLRTGAGTDGVIGFSRDVTERKRYEQRLERQNERLEEFASIVSHDLRNPLTVAEGRLELARETDEGEHFDAVSRAHERMRVLIDDLLTLAREGEQARDTETVSLAAVVEGCWETVAITEATLLTETEREIRADRTRLQQLLENLLRNAIDHGGDDVTVTVGDLVDGFYVADDGPGIPAAEREGVVEAGYSTAAEGTGFGLAIVTEIADAHGWEVAVTDSGEGGARFEITGVEFAE